VRGRITVIASAVVAVTVSAGAIGFGAVLQSTLLEQATVAAEAQLDRFESLIDASGPTALNDADGFAQLIGDDGRVRAASDDADEVPALADSEFEGGREVTLPEDDDPVFIVSAEVDGGVLVVGVDDEARREAISTTALLLLAALPLLVALVAVTCWVVVGRALRPVDRIRRETEGVSAADLSRRVGVPGTGDEIDALAVTMNHMLERLDNAQSRQRRFVSDASHELRSPIASLRQSSEVMLRYPGRVPVEEFARTTSEESQRMADLVEGLLLLARADEHGLALSTQPTDLDDLVLAEASRLRALVATTSADADADGNGVESPPIVIDARGVSAAQAPADARLIARVVRNLGDNALRHARSRVWLSSTVHGAVAVVSVANDGANISDADKSRIWDRFERLDDARSRDQGGSGLGLSIVAEIVSAHGGSAQIVDVEGGGVRFDIHLPLQR
jgi:signal transduction histidine kinase